MRHECIDTNVIIRFLTGTPPPSEIRIADIFNFFESVEEGRKKIYLPDIVLFQCWFVLTSYYRTPPDIAADKLAGIVSFRGILMEQKEILIKCFQILKEHRMDMVDAWILAYSHHQGITKVYSFDKGLLKHGLKSASFK